MNDLLRNALILDIETTSLARGAGIHELALYDIEASNLVEYILEANLVSVQNNAPQDVAKHASSYRDTFKRVKVSSWYQAITNEVLARNGIKGNRQALFESLRWNNPFLYKAIFEGKHPHLSGQVEGPLALASREARFRRLGITSSLNERHTIEDVLKSNLPQAIKGKTVYIANAKFEASQIGAQLAASGIDWKHIFETSSRTSPDPFYVTGVQVNKARVAAQLTGDWRGVWEAYSKYTPKRGETAVRDIQDILRAMQSYGKELGLFKGGKAYYGAGIDITSHLFALAEGNLDILGLRETHRAAEDAAIHESYVLKKAIQYTSALQAVQENTPIGKQLLSEGKQGKGLLGEVTKYFSALEQAAPNLQRASLLQRFGRAFEDIETTGETYQVTGRQGIVSMSQVTPEGKTVLVPRLEHKLERFTSMDKVAEFLKHSGDYSDFGVDVEGEYARFRSAAKSTREASLFIDREISSLHNVTYNDLKLSLSKLENLSSNNFLPELLETSIRKVSAPKLGIAALAMTALGAAMSVVDQPVKEQTHLLGYNYQDWLAAQEGMSIHGWAKENRSKNTDFGSPYQGPFVSNQVLEQQKLLEEREKWLRSSFHAQHYDPWTGLLGVMGPFHFTSGYQYLTAGEKVPFSYKGLRGQDLVSLKLDDNWKLSAEDADTVTIRRAGLRGAISSFFGFNKGYSFRLAGIDAPEISHHGRAAQPFANEATEALRNMLKASKDTELVFSTSDTSYGRMVGAVIADGENLNYSLVQQGLVTHLPYGKAEDAIIDYRKLKVLQEQAFEANKGFWATSWGKTFHEVNSITGQQPTFNTLANPQRVAQSTSYINMLTAMNVAEDTNTLPSQNVLESITRNFSPKDNPFPMRFTKPMMPQGHSPNSFALDGFNTKLNNPSELDYGLLEAKKKGINKAKLRKMRMAEAQTKQNQRMFDSPIQHYRM